MANEMIQLWAKAKKLGIEGYRKMSVPDLKSAIKSADKSAAEPVEATSTNGKTSKRKSAAKTGTARSTTKRKSAKSASSAKQTPAKSTQKSGTAKRSASGAKRGSAKTTTARAPRTDNSAPGRNLIDNEQIDWTAESSIGQSGGNRGEIMKYLRKFKGDVDKVWDKLAPNAKQMYPKTQDGRARSKDAAETLLTWHISRVKFDFVKDTGQHVSSTNRVNGPVTRSPAPSSSRKAAGASRSSAKKRGTAKSTGAKRGPQKAAGARRGGAKKSGAAKRKATRR